MKKMKDSLNQDVNIGDWIATIPKGARSVIIGKVVGESKSGNPLIKRNHAAKAESVGLTCGGWIQDSKGIWSRGHKIPHFIKITPTKQMELDYENIS